jgi:hypothetical protein
MAARRDRERRRPPTERRYTFGSPDAALEAEGGTLAETNGDVGASGTAPARTAIASRPSPAAQGLRKTFSEYRAEYAYVVGDLRRVAVVIGSLLLILLVLYFVMPR